MLANTRQTSAGSLTPELSLHLVGPGCALWTATEHDLSVLKKDIQVEVSHIASLGVGPTFPLWPIPSGRVRGGAAGKVASLLRG